jgi:hypothetical protein
MANTEKDLKKVTKNLETINKKLSETTNKAISEMSESYDSVVDRSKELYNILQKQKLLEEGISKLKVDQVDYAKLAAVAKKDGNVELQKESVLLSKSAKYQIEQAKRAKEDLQRLYEITDLSKEQLKQQEKLTKLNKKYNETILDSLSFVDDITEKIGSIPVVGDILVKALGADKLKEKLADKVTSALVGVETAGVSLIPILASIGAAFALIKFSVDINKETTELARNLGKSNKEARGLRKEMADISVNSENALMSIKNQTAAMEALATEAGTNKIISKDLIENQVVLTNNLGLTTEAAAKLNTTFVAMGKSVSGTTDEIMETVAQTEKATGASINMKEVLTEISSVSAEVRGSFQGNVKALTLQVIKAKALGLTLDKIAEIGKQSLEIESSIGKEMEARVLTGKALDLNAFRLAALNKDQAGMQKELVKQAGSFAEFNNLNSIAQGSMAEAFGMTVSEMANMLQKGELMKKLNTDLTKISYDELANREDLTADEKDRLKTMKLNADVSDKMAKAAESMKEIFTGLAVALQPVLDGFAGIMSHATAIKAIIEAIATTISIVMLPSLWQSVKAAASLAAELVVSAVAAITEASAVTLGLGAIGIAAGIAVGVAAMNSAKSSTSIKDGEIAPDGGLVVSGQKGTYQLHKDDTVIAGTSLGDVANTKNSSSTTSNTSVDNSELVSLLKQLIAKVDQPVQIVVGNKVIDELDTHISLRKTYNTKVDHGYGVFG